jgi:hypothetical protein
MLTFLRKLLRYFKENRERSLFPEKEFVISIADDKISCERPNGEIEEVTWNELKKIEIYTTNQGPFAEDVFWVLHGDGRGCIIPKGATNNEEMLTRLQKLPEFDNAMVIEAMSCTENKEFLIWQK